MVLRKIVFFLIAKLVFGDKTYTSGDEDIQDKCLEFKPDMSSEALLNYCYNHGSSRKTERILRETLVISNSSQSSEDTVRVLQWNILAQALGPIFGNFNKCPIEALLWPHRRCDLLEEILSIESDVMCFQEVDHFDFFNRALATQSYSGVFVPKVNSPCLRTEENNGPDGCAIFYNNQKYELLETHELLYTNSSKSSNSSRQVALLIVLRNKSSDKRLCVATTHLKSGKREDESLLRNEQGKEFLKFVSQHASDYPTVICGDFNDKPTESVYKTMTTHPEFKLKSAYNISNKEPDFTTWKIRGGREIKRTVDYIFYTTKYLTIGSIVLMPNDNLIGENRIPSCLYPSDHFSLITNFFYKTSEEIIESE